MPDTAGIIERSLEAAAVAAGFPDGPALEADAEAYARWVSAPLPDLDQQAPAAVAARLPLAALLTQAEASARRRGPDADPARVWLDEAVSRLQAEAAAAGDPPVLAAVAELALREPEAEDQDNAAVHAGLAILARWAAPAAIPVLVSTLALADPRLRQRAAEALGRCGLPGLSAIRERLQATRLPEVRLALLLALCHLPRDRRVTAILQDAWTASPPDQRPTLAAAWARYGDPDLAPPIAAELARSTRRADWAAYRAALAALGYGGVITDPPPPAAGDEAADLALGAETLWDSGLADQAREWLRQALEQLAALADHDPGAVDWPLFERAHRLADRCLDRSPELALLRFTDYCFGALHYYGVLSLDQLHALVTITGVPGPGPDALWTAVTADDRFAALSDRTVALSGLTDPGTVLERRAGTGLQPALFTLRHFALSARGLGHLAWTAAEEEAATALMQLLPENLGRPERIVALQTAMRLATGDPQSLQEWLSHAAAHGLEGDDEIQAALRRLWRETPAWELFGHSPRGAEEWLALLQAQQEAHVAPTDPCPCGSGRRFDRCCGRAGGGG